MLKRKVHHKSSWHFLIPSVILISTSSILTDTASIFLSAQISVIKGIEALFTYFCILFSSVLPVLQEQVPVPCQEMDRKRSSKPFMWQLSECSGRYPWEEEVCVLGIKPAKCHFCPTLEGKQRCGKRVWLHQGPVCWHCFRRNTFPSSSPSSINQDMKTRCSCSLKNVATYNFPSFHLSSFLRNDLF